MCERTTRCDCGRVHLVDRLQQLGYRLDAAHGWLLRAGTFVLRSAFLTLGTALLIYLFAWGLLVLLDFFHPIARGAVLRR